MLIESLDDWPEGLQPPAWLSEMEILTLSEAIALTKLGIDIKGAYCCATGAGSWHRNKHELELEDLGFLEFADKWYDILYLPR